MMKTLIKDKMMMKIKTIKIKIKLKKYKMMKMLMMKLMIVQQCKIIKVDKILMIIKRKQKKCRKI